MIKPEVLDAMVAAGCTAEQIAAAVKADMASSERSAGAIRQARYRMRGGGVIPEQMRQAVFERDEFACLDCGATNDLCCDHVVPVSKGGATTEENLQTLCRSCNSRKKDRIRKFERRNSADMAGHPGHSEEQVPPKKETSPTPPKEKTTPSKSEANASSNTPRAALETVLDPERAAQVIEHRQRIRKPLTVRAAQLLAREFAKCADPNAGADAMLKNGWQGFEPEWMDRKKSGGSPPQSKPQTVQELGRALELELTHGYPRPRQDHRTDQPLALGFSSR